MNWNNKYQKHCGTCGSKMILKIAERPDWFSRETGRLEFRVYKECSNYSEYRWYHYFGWPFESHDTYFKGHYSEEGFNEICRKERLIESRTSLISLLQLIECRG